MTFSSFATDYMVVGLGAANADFTGITTVKINMDGNPDWRNGTYFIHYSGMMGQ